MTDGGLDELDRPEQLDRPLVVIRGDASAEEVAALVAVLLQAARTAPAAAAGAPPEWSSPRRRLRVPQSPGPGAWRASSLP